MKKIFIILASIAVMTACGGSKEEPNGGGGQGGGGSTTTPTITFGTGVNTNPVIGTEGGNVDISFTASDTWTAGVINTRADSWVSVSPSSGAKGSAKITITTKANDTPDERGATIQIKSGTTTKNIVLTQKQKDSFTASASKTELGKEGGTFTIEVKANVSFSFTIDKGSEWIKHVSTKALKTSTITFEASENEDVDKREGQITVTSSAGKETFKIYQDGATPTIILTSNTVNVAQAGGTVQVEVKSNVDVSVAIQDGITWVSEVSSKAMSTNTWNFSVEENDTNDNRTADIYFTNKANNLSEKVQIVQAQKNAIVIAKDHYDMTANGGNFTVTVTHNVNFDIEISGDWITRASGTKAMTQDDIVFTVAENTTGDGRTGTVKFKAGDLVQTVTVIQAQKDAIVIAKDHYDIPVEGGNFDVTISRNVDYQVIINADWITRVGTKAMTSETVTFNVSNNPNNDSRTGTITFKSGSIEQTVTVVQAQKDAIVIAQSSYDIGTDGGTIEVSVSHNVDFEAVANVDWITRQAGTKAMTTETVVFVVSENQSGIARSGVITFTAGNLVQKVTVNQAYVAPAEPEFPGVYGISGIKYSYNKDTDQLIRSTQNTASKYYVITPSTNKFLIIETNDSIIDIIISEGPEFYQYYIGEEVHISITQNINKSVPVAVQSISTKISKISGDLMWLKDDNGKTAIIKFK